MTKVQQIIETDKCRRDFSPAFSPATALLAAVILLNGCGNPSKNRDVSKEFPFGKVEIQGLSGAACAAPGYIAEAKGFFAAEGIDVTLVSGTFETNKTGLASGKFPIAIGDFQYFPSANEGLDIKLVGGLHEGCIKLLVPPGSSIREGKDLVGKRIGVDEIGGSPMAITSVFLAHHNINPVNGVEWLPFPGDQLQAVAEKGEVDAVALWDPFGALAIRKGYHVLCDIGEHPLFAGKYCCFLYVSGKQLKENPERIKAILRAYHKAGEWVSAHPEETAKILVEKGYVAADDPELIAELIESYRYHAKHGAKTRLKAKEDALYFTNELKRTGFLPADLDAHSFVDKLYYELKVEDEENAAEGHSSNEVKPAHN
ncbi:MAG: ABC transporter substrate-binding protein [Tannerella sp.]|jgi:NitT/TauT family transport system substrate-binding protein|nr:ABC transporter substrate-binding protein [Tannerella sp.]